MKNSTTFVIVVDHADRNLIRRHMGSCCYPTPSENGLEVHLVVGCKEDIIPTFRAMPLRCPNDATISYQDVGEDPYTVILIKHDPKCHQHKWRDSMSLTHSKGHFIDTKHLYKRVFYPSDGKGGSDD